MGGESIDSPIEDDGEFSADAAEDEDGDELGDEDEMIVTVKRNPQQVMTQRMMVMMAAEMRVSRPPSIGNLRILLMVAYPDILNG